MTKKQVRAKECKLCKITKRKKCPRQGHFPNNEMLDPDLIVRYIRTPKRQKKG